MEEGCSWMSDETTELKLAANFEPATYEAWLALVAKVLKGSDFESRLVSRTLDDIRIAPGDAPRRTISHLPMPDYVPIVFTPR